jgi:hypothetical protein
MKHTATSRLTTMAKHKHGEGAYVSHERFVGFFLTFSDMWTDSRRYIPAQTWFLGHSECDAEQSLGHS